MPRLTPDNVLELARRARLHCYGGRCATPPQSLATIEARAKAMTQLRAFVHVFGPQTIRGTAGSYQHVHATGLVDCLDQSSVYIPEDQKPVVTIEQQLADKLREYPAAAGFDVVVVFHGPARDVQNWIRFDAETRDDDARECFRRAER
jgi:hypothetical protein